MVHLLALILLAARPPIATAEENRATDDLPAGLAARIDGRPLPLAEFDRYLAEKYLREEIGQAARDQLIDEILVTQEAARRGIEVSEREISRRLEQLGAQVRRSGGSSLQDYLESQGVAYDDFMAALEKSIAQEKMARQDYGLTPGDSISEAKLRMWLKERRQKAAIETDGIGEKLCARVNSQPVTLDVLGSTIRKTLAKDELHKALVELTGIVLVERLISTEGIELSDADLEREVSNRETILRRRYGVQQISLPDILGVDLATLVSSRRFRAEAALGKIVDTLYDRAALEAYYQEHKSAFDARFGAQIEVAIIFRKAVIRPNELIMRTFEQAIDELTKVKQQAIEGRPFAELAHIYSEHPSAKEGGKLGYLTGNEPGLREIYDLARTLDPGEIGGPLRATDGVYLVLSTDRRPPPSFDDLVLEVRQAVRQQHYRTLFKDVQVEQRW